MKPAFREGASQGADGGGGTTGKGRETLEGGREGDAKGKIGEERGERRRGQKEWCGGEKRGGKEGWRKRQNKGEDSDIGKKEKEREVTTNDEEGKGEACVKRNELGGKR